MSMFMSNYAYAVSLLPTDYKKKKKAKNVRGSGAFVPSQSFSGSTTARGRFNGRIFISRLHILSSVGQRGIFFSFFLWPHRLNYAHSVVVSSNYQRFIDHQNVLQCYWRLYRMTCVWRWHPHNAAISCLFVSCWMVRCSSKTALLFGRLFPLLLVDYLERKGSDYEAR